MTDNKCLECNKFEIKTKTALRNHLRKHKILMYDYALKHFYNGIVPRCKCGCNKETNFLSNNRFAEWIVGHYSRVNNNGSFKKGFIPWNKRTPEELHRVNEDNIAHKKVICLECGFRVLSNRGLGVHLQFVHKVSSEKYVVKHEYNGIHPTCKCGCGKETRFTGSKYGFKTYRSGHNDNYSRDDLEKYRATCEKISKSKLGDKNPAKRPEVRAKISANSAAGRPDVKARNAKSNRLRRIKEIEEKRCQQVYPNFNSRVCNIIEHMNVTHGYNFQHAKNGGEFYVKGLGYWVDGYDAEKNIVYEFYENKHLQQLEHDERRISEIVEHLECNVIIHKEWELNDEIAKVYYE